MTNENVRLYPHDRWLEKMGLLHIPETIRPNQITVLRFIMIPFVLLAVLRQAWFLSLALFLGAALTDVVDGSLARLRRQITAWGTVADPLADKLLIGSVMLVFVLRILAPWVTVTVLSLEALILIGAYIRQRRGLMSSANVYGKLKMLFQVISVAVLLGAQSFGWTGASSFALITLGVALAFATMSFLTYGL